MIWIAFGVGLFLGTCFGIIAICLCHAVKGYEYPEPSDCEYLLTRALPCRCADCPARIM